MSKEKTYGIVGTWRSIEEKPEDGRTVLVCGDSILQMVDVKHKDDGIGFYEPVFDRLIGVDSEGFVDRWAYIELPDSEGEYQ